MGSSLAVVFEDWNKTSLSSAIYIIYLLYLSYYISIVIFWNLLSLVLGESNHKSLWGTSKMLINIIVRIVRLLTYRLLCAITDLL